MEAEAPEAREQARQVREVVSRRQSGLQEGDFWYVLSLRWWDLWRDYARYGEDAAAADPEAEAALAGEDAPPMRRQLSGVTKGARPPAIDNSELTVRPDSARLQRGLQEYSDFVLLHEEAWLLLSRWYGGGPALKRAVISVGEGSSSELRVELYPLWLTVYRVDLGGHPDRERPMEVTFSRTGRAQDLLRTLCDAWGIAEVGEESVRLWHRGNVEVDQTDCTALEGWDKLQPASKTLEELLVVDGACLLLEQSKVARQQQYGSAGPAAEWPFFHRLRLEYKKQAYKDPRDPAVRLAVDDAIDACVEADKDSYSYGRLATWYPATVVGEDEQRVLVQFHNREKPRAKLPPLLTDGGWLSEKQLTAEAKAALETVFKRYATDGRIDKAAMRGLMSCATNMLVQEDSWQVCDLLSKYGDGQSVELDGFQKYWRQKAVSNNYWLEDELSRLFDRVGASLGTQSEEAKLLAQGREWIPRTSTRLAQYRSNEYPYSANRAKRGFRDFRRYDNVDVNFGGEWKQVEVQEVNWEEMTVLVQTRDTASSWSASCRPQREWIPMESERIAEYQTKSLEVVDEDPAPLLARSSSRGGVCARPGACGLQNLGNTCFMNSTLQCLSNCSALRAFFAGGPEEKPPFLTQISSSPLSLNGRLAREFSRLLFNMWSNTHESCAPAELKALVGQKRPEFGGYQQQDAQELLIFLLDGLHEDVNRAPYPRVVVPEVEADGRPDEVVAQEAWSGHKRRNDSRIVELFQFQIRSEVECPVCRNVSVTFDPIMYLSLPVPKPPHAVSLTMVPAEYPRSPMLRMDVPVPRGATFEELERRLWEKLQRRPGERRACFIFADVWSDRVYKMFQDSHKISEIQHGDNIYALEVAFAPGAPEGGHTFVPVLFRKQQKNTYAFSSSQYSFDRVAPPRVLGVPEGATNAHVHGQLSAMAGELLGSSAQGQGFDVVTQIDTIASARGETLPADEARFSIGHQQHVGVNFLDTDAVAGLQAALPRIQQHKGGEATAGTGNMTLQQCLLKNAEREQLSEEDAVYCRKCKEHRQCYKKIELWSLPTQLIVHLKRFGRDRIDGPLTKITTAVEFPLELDLTPYLAKAQAGCAYDLFGVVNHHGGLGGGHYTAHALVTPLHEAAAGHEEGEWYNFNDSRVSKASAGDIDHSAGYILFYRRREEPKKK